MKYQAIKRNSLNLFVTIELTGFLLACQFFQPINLTLHVPVIMTPEKEIFGALGEEKMHIAQFAQESSNFAQPQRKTFKDIQIAGPFKVYIGDSDQASELFFVSRAKWSTRNFTVYA